MNRIQIQNLAFAYGQHSVLQNLNLEIEEGILCGVVGPNGAGKSTLVKLLAGLLHPSSGQILIGNTEVHAEAEGTVAKMIATVPQESNPSFGFTVSEMVMMARFIRQKRILFERPEDWQAIQEALQESDISNLADRSMNSLSGGERQRVYLARALAQDTPILLLDEPASHLDLKHQVQVYDLLKQLQSRKKKTIVMVTHDLNLAGQYCDKIVMLGLNGEVFYGNSDEVLKEDTISQIFDVKCLVLPHEKTNFFLPTGKWMANPYFNEL